MNTSQTLKASKFDKNQKETAASIGRSLGQLENDLAATLEHQAYAIKNPDLIIDPEYLDSMLVSVDELAAKFASIGALCSLINDVRTSTISVDDMILSRGIDLIAYAKSLALQK